MSVLAMILAAGVVLGDGPGRVSGEVERGLDLNGEWKGRWWYKEDEYYDARSFVDGSLAGTAGRRWFTHLRLKNIVDEGDSKLRVAWFSSEDVKSQRLCHGIYWQEGDQLIICFRDRTHPRPTSFRAGNGQHLLILHRVKPRK